MSLDSQRLIVLELGKLPVSDDLEPYDLTYLRYAMIALALLCVGGYHYCKGSGKPGGTGKVTRKVKEQNAEMA